MIDVRRNGRVAEGTPLLRVQTGKNRSRGFESLFLRHFLIKTIRDTARHHETFAVSSVVDIWRTTSSLEDINAGHGQEHLKAPRRQAFSSTEPYTFSTRSVPLIYFQIHGGRQAQREVSRFGSQDQYHGGQRVGRAFPGRTHKRRSSRDPEGRIKD